jgi:peptide chain release factor 2
MENLMKKLADLRQRLASAYELLEIDRLLKRVKELNLLMSEPDFWQDRVAAVKVGQEKEELDRLTGDWVKLTKDTAELEEMVNLMQAEEGDDLLAELEDKYNALALRFSRLEFISLFSEKYDHDNVIISIHAGTGGVDAQDWTQILERMYLRFCERQSWRVEIMDRNYGNEAGLKSVMFRVVGAWAYGYLKSENGVHRLLRNSPFDADGARHTSFSLVEVMPEIPESEEIMIKDEDLRIDVYRSSGPGGQSVNTTDSAVRLVHLPSGLTVTCQSERSQHQNKENAMKILRAKLYQQAVEIRESEERKLKGEVQKAEWGRQIRSYFLYGNRLIKDHRSEYETANVEAVLDGDIMNFLEAYLRWRKR